MSSQYFDNNVYEENNELEPTILIEGIVWEQQNTQEQTTMSVNEVNKSVLEDSRNETFLSVNEEGNTTEYFSVLEMTDDSVMNDLNLTAVNPTVVDENTFSQDAPIDEVSDQSNIFQPILYEIEGSNEYLAVQVTCDEEGIMRRIQFKMRQNENGELVPIVGTTEILPIDEDIDLGEFQENTIENEKLDEQGEEQEQCNDFKDNQQNVVEQNLLNPQIKIKMEEHGDDIISDLPNNKEVDAFQNEKVNSQTKQSISVIESVSSRQDWIKSEILQESSTDSDFTLDLDGLEENYVNVMDSIECSNVQNDGPPSELFSDSTVNENIIENETNLTDHNLALTYSNSKDPDLYTHLNSEVIITRVRQGVRNFMESPGNSDDGLSSDGENAEDIGKYTKILDNDMRSSEDNVSSNGSDVGEYRLTETATNDVAGSKILEKTNLFQVNNKANSIKQQSILMDKTINSKSNGDLKSNKNQVYYVLKHPEKENVAVPRVNTNKTYKVNPRSILKTSFVQLEHQHQKEMKNEIIKQENKNLTNIPIEKIDKRFARNKEIMQAILFQNYIAKTTIPHAPVRQGRMPRKQKIKPVERADEEIIVKEVAVSSEGFVEIPEENLFLRANVEIVQLSDSENDFESRQDEYGFNHSRRYRSDASEIVISDSEDESSENAKVVQIDLSADSDENDNNRSDSREKSTKKPRGRPRKNIQKAEMSDISILKRKRGRPPKKKPITDEEKTNESVSSPKKQRTDESESARSTIDDTSSSKLDSSEEKAENLCPKCSKSFPSQSSLKTHLQYHTLQEASARRTNMRLTATTSMPSERYQCHKCGEIFKNNALLTKHEKLHNSNALECHVCHKVFTELAQLSTHKRSHVKEQMFKATVPPKISPKPCRVSSKVFKTPPPLKCPVCTKTFATILTLNAHKNNFHRQFSCKTCGKLFYSKVAWESHVKNSCVKPKSPEKRRLSLNVRKSFLVPPQPQRTSRRLSIKGRRKSNNGKQKRQSCVKPDFNVTERTRTPAGLVKAPCDMCEVVCLSFKHLFQHKVSKHGLETPDKSVVENPIKKALFKDKAEQGGVPVTMRIGNAWAGLKNKID